MKTPSAMGGTRHRCPACRGQIVVPGGRRVEEPAPQSQPTPPAKRRPLRPGVTYIPVVCSRCQTRMYATEEEVGREVTCPECGTATRVEQPKGEAPVKKTPVAKRRPLRSGVTYIPVVCSRCQTRMYATEEEVGQEVTCPDCGTATRVTRPKVETPVKKAPPPQPDPAAKRRYLRPGINYIPVVCPRCETRMYATEEELGREVTCPECGIATRVEWPKGEAPVKKAWAPIEIDEDEYQLCDGVDQPEAGSRAFARYIPVICPVCSTRMLATEEQVGQQIVCPDCTVATTVPPPEPPEVKKRPPVVIIGQDEYRLHDGVDQPPPGATYIPIVCGVCGTLLYAGEDQVGRKITCPDCETRHLVPPPGPDAVRHDPMAGAEEEYRLGKPIEAPEIRTGVDYREEGRAEGDLASDRVRRGQPEPERSRPRWVFFSGVFHFPFYRGSLGCWIGLSMGLLVVIGLMAIAVALSEIESQATWIASMVCSGVTFTSAAIWFVIASAYLLSVIRDTANGMDEVENWPEMVFLDWLGDSYFVFSSFAIGLLPGMAARHIFLAAGWDATFCLPVGMLIAFPLLLVSMLETNSPLKPFSTPVLGTLWTAWWAWAVFYVESTLVLLAALLVGDGLAMLVGPWALAIGVPVLIAAVMIYCRLLGRLIWYSSGAAG